MKGLSGRPGLGASRGGRVSGPGRSSRRGFAFHGRSRFGPGVWATPFLRSNRARGSTCVPPGRQSRPRFSPCPSTLRPAHCACSGLSHSLPRANHFMTTSWFVRCSCASVGCSSSCLDARKAVGLLSIRIVQYAYLGGIPRLYSRESLLDSGRQTAGVQRTAEKIMGFRGRCDAQRSATHTVGAAGEVRYF
jgi:hypothetical protein